jgi:hypothetical protein
VARCGQCKSRLTARALYCPACGARRADHVNTVQIDGDAVLASRPDPRPGDLNRTGAGGIGADGGIGFGGIAGPHRTGPSKPLLLDRPLIGIGGAPVTATSGHRRDIRDGLNDRTGLDGLGVVEVGGPSGGGRRRALALGAGAIAVVGALAVLSRGGDQATGDNANDRTAASTTTTRAGATTTSEASVTTATPTTAVLVLGPLLPELSGVSLIYVGSGGQVQRADLDTGRVESLPVKLGNDGGQVMSLGGDALIAMNHSGERGPGVTIYPAGGGEPVHVVGQQFWKSTTPGRVWVLENNFFGGDPTSSVNLIEFDASGVAQRNLALPQGVNWAFPVGDAVFVVVAGGVYRFDPDTGRSGLVAHGEIRSSYGDAAATAMSSIDMYVCDAALTCAIKTFDPDGNEIASRAADVSSDGSQSAPDGEIPSPDGRYRATFDYETSQVSILDAKGTSLWGSPGRFGGGFDLMNGPSSLRWSNDSKWLFIQTSRGLKAWTAGRSDLVDIALERVGAFDVVAEP